MPRPGKKPAGEASNSNKKCKRYFNEQWKGEFPWLEFDYDRKLMFCVVCRQALVKNKHGKADNAFTVGTDNFQRHALLRHVTSGAHRHALDATRETAAWGPLTPTNEEDLKSPVRREISPAKIAILTTIYWMAKEDIPDSKLHSLLELQKYNLCQSLLTGEHHEYYTAHNVKEMQEAIAMVLHDEGRRRMTDSPFIGLVVKETVDIPEHKKLVLFATTVSPYDGQASVIFLGHFDLPDGETQTVVDRLVEIMNSSSIPLSKVPWLASDGMSVSSDKICSIESSLKPLCPLLKHFHWYSQNNWLALAGDILDIVYVRKYEEAVDALFNLFSSLEDENNSLGELETVLKSCQIHLKDSGPVRWTSVLSAVEAINSLWPTLVLLLEGEAGKSPLALGLCEELKKFQFVALTKVLLDILPVLQKLGQFFQAEEVDLSTFKPLISATLACLRDLRDTNGQHFQQFLSEMNEHPLEDSETDCRLYYKGVELTHCSKEHLQSFGQLKEAYLDQLCESLQDKLPEEMVEVTNAFAVLFSPLCYLQVLEDIMSYGLMELTLLLDHYGHLVSQERARRDFPLFKRIVVSLGHLPLRELCVQLVLLDSEMHELFPDFATLASIALVLPLNSATRAKVCRAGDQTKRLLRKESWRNIKIVVDGPTINEFDFEAAIDHFETMKDKQIVF
ncbi:uncharacterized protein C17orf113 [Amia ocellicauda]|uniref:uncharacterized protein C17orf113 n=1 Tax=Amia ocellicauda TaxID=2972642 RepID=UPI003463CAEB|nr:ZN862 protein [Amia calva]